MAEKTTVKVDPDAAQQIAAARVARARKGRAFEAATEAVKLAGDDKVLKLIVKPKRSFKWKTGKILPDGKPEYTRFSPGMKFECTGAEFRANKVLQDNTVPDLDAIEVEAIEAARAALNRADAASAIPGEGGGV